MRWDLLNTHGVLSTVAPSYYVQGAMNQPFFPGYAKEGEGEEASKKEKTYKREKVTVGIGGLEKTPHPTGETDNFPRYRCT